MGPKNFSVRQDDQGIYHLQGELSIHEVDKLRGFLVEALKGGQDIVISLARVTFIDIAAIQLLIVFKRWCQPKGKFLISAASAEVENIINLSGLKTELM